jgi:hypothetical protein
MDEKTMLVVAEKIKNKTATKEETEAFLEEFNKALEDVKDILGKE